jgi:predicted phosphodiesterase
VKTIVVISDLQVPYEHKRAVSALERFITGWRPDQVICVGDEMDAPQVSRWTKGTAGEYAGKLAKDRDATGKVLERLKVSHVMRSNHGERLKKYVAASAPALADEPELQYERYMRFADIGVTYHKSAWEFAPGWLLMHGDEGTLSPIAGSTAMGLARRTGRSVVCGHTHRAGFQHHTESFGGTFHRTLIGLEVGCLMDIKSAGYTGGIANWTLGFGVFYVDGKHVQPNLVFMKPDGSFLYDRVVWR